MITEYKEPILVDGKQCLGVINYDDGTIAISKNEENTKPVTLMHEAVHGILYSRGFNDESMDEKLVDGVSRGVIQLIRDNPQLIKYIIETGKL